MQKFLEVAGLEYKGLDHEEMAKIAAKIQYQDCPSYRFLIHTYFGLTDFEFVVNSKEEPVDNIGRNGCKFYELFDYQYISVGVSSSPPLVNNTNSENGFVLFFCRRLLRHHR